MSRLVGHLGRVQSWVSKCVADPSGQDTKAERPPASWDELIPWWDAQVAGMREALTDPDRPAFMAFARYPQVTASWARRQAHEAAIHRLDAETALSMEPSFAYDPDFAADGIDELIAWMAPSRSKWADLDVAGTIVFRTSDTSRAWTARLKPGLPPEIEARETEGDLMIEGAADAVYRRAWGRPSLAVVTGDTTLLEPLVSP